MPIPGGILMLKRVISVFLASAIAIATMGADGCSTDNEGGGKGKTKPQGLFSGSTGQQGNQGGTPGGSDNSDGGSNAPSGSGGSPTTTAGGDNCDPSYSGACLSPNSSDYDCEGGTGDGPDYVGEVQVTGSDPFDLDADGDGVGCDA